MLSQCSMTLLVGIVATAGFVAIPLGLMLNVFGLLVFRWWMGRRMGREISVQTEGASIGKRSRSLGELKVTNIDANKHKSPSSAARPSALAKRNARRRAYAYAIAGAAYAAIVALSIVLRMPQAGAHRMPVMFLLAFFVTLPPIIVISSVAYHHRGHWSVLVGFVVVILLGAFTSSPVLQTLILASIMFTGFFLVVTLLFLTRWTRAVGPAALTTTFLGLLTLAGGVGLTAHYLHTEAMTRVWSDFCSAVETAALYGIADQRYPLVLVQLEEIIQRVPVLSPAKVLLWLGAAVVVVWLYMGWQARKLHKRHASDIMQTLDVSMIMLSFGFAALLFYAPSQSRWLSVLAVIIALAVFHIVSRCLLKRWCGVATSPVLLLFLRVFNFDRRTQDLMSDFGSRARTFGPIAMVAGTDLITTTVERHQFYGFLSGIAPQSFISDSRAVAERLEQFDETPTPDGTYAVVDCFCYENTWQNTVKQIATVAGVALLDLRSFTAKNAGCVAEIKMLLDVLPVDKIVIVVDAETQLEALSTTLGAAWNDLAIDSPNATSGVHVLRLLTESKNLARTRDALLDMVHCGVSGPRSVAQSMP